MILNISKKTVQWSLDIRKNDKFFKNGIFKFTALIGSLKPNEKYTISIHFCPSKHFSIFNFFLNFMCISFFACIYVCIIFPVYTPGLLMPETRSGSSGTGDTDG